MNNEYVMSNKEQWILILSIASVVIPFIALVVWRCIDIYNNGMGY